MVIKWVPFLQNEFLRKSVCTYLGHWLRCVLISERSSFTQRVLYIVNTVWMTSIRWQCDHESKYFPRDHGYENCERFCVSLSFVFCKPFSKYRLDRHSSETYEATVNFLKKNCHRAIAIFWIPPVKYHQWHRDVKDDCPTAIQKQTWLRL